MESAAIPRYFKSLLVVVDESNRTAFAQAKSALYRNSGHVLLTGEPGVGKEHLAQQIHRHSRRRGKFIAVDCAALNHDTAVRELFGIERADQSDSNASNTGLLGAAEHGTLFLNEVADLPNPIQVLLSRVMRRNRMRPVGTVTEQETDVRIVASTTVPLDRVTSRGMFRLDLYARLTDIQIHIPAIRERRQDILEILANLAVSEGLKLRVDADAAEALLLGAWPLNVCGLRQVVARITSRKSGVLDLATLRKIEPALATELKSRRNSPTRSSVKLPNAHKTLRERSSLEQLLAEHHGNVAKVAKDLGTTRAQIYRWMSRLGIDVDSLRGIG